MIKYPSALDSIERRGLLHDGKLSVGGIVTIERNAQIENVTHKRNACDENVTTVTEIVTLTDNSVTDSSKNVTALSNAERQKLYRQRKREAKK